VRAREPAFGAADGGGDLGGAPGPAERVQRAHLVLCQRSCPGCWPGRKAWYRSVAMDPSAAAFIWMPRS